MRTSLALVSLLLLSGMSDPADPCSHAAATASSFAAKAEACAFDGALPFDAVSCRAATAACGAADRATIDGFLSCLDAMPVCATGREAAWRAQFEQCAAGARLSAGCSL